MRIGVSAQNIFKKNPTGVEIYTQKIIQALSGVCDSNDEIIVYTSSSLFIQHFLSSITSANISFRIINLKRFFNLLGVSLAVLQTSPDVIFCPSSVIPIWGAWKSIVTIHGLEFKTFPRAYSFFDRLWISFATYFSVHFSKKIIVPSDATRKDVMKYYNIKPEKISVIFHGPTAEISLDETLSLPKNKEQILFLGRIEKRKNLEVLIDAFAKVLVEFPNAKLILAGHNGFGWRDIVEKVEKLGYLKKFITFSGYVNQEEKKRLLLSSGILAFPSKAEGFGFPILEGQAAKCAVICSDLEVSREIAGLGALFFKKESVDNLAQKILDLMKNDQLRENIINLGIKNLERFSWQKSAWETYNVLKS